ncbi:glycosyl hydrolase family 28-related protein [Sphingomonas sp.]|uniref:glycosyl hydrolase family 28-related protein n=1 Tax=Sphingomonas sp. TaxID=28214 RepID=UPI0035C7DB69
MTVETTSTYAGPYTTDGAAVAFPFGFKALSLGEVRVEIGGQVVDPSLYGVTLAAQGGAVTFYAPPPAGRTLYVVSDPTFKQGIAFSNQSAFLPNSHNEANDRGAIRDQVLAEGLGRAIQLPLGESAPVLPPAAERAGGNKIIAPDPLTGAITVLDGSAFKGNPGGNTMAIGLFAIAATLLIPLGTDLVQTSGYSKNGVGKARYVADPTVTTNTRSTFVSANGRGFRLGEVAVDVTMLGALGDNVQDDRPPIQAAIDFKELQGGGEVWFPDGTFKVSLTNRPDMFQLFALTQPGGISLVGQGRTRSIIRLQDDDPIAGAGAAIRIIATPPGNHNGLGCYTLGVDGNLPNQPKLANSPGNGGNIVYGLFEGIPNNVVIDNCASYNAYGQGIQVAGYADYDAINGAYPNVAVNVRITNNDVYRCSFIGIQVAHFKSLHVVLNKVALTGDNAIDLYGFNNNFAAPGITSGRGTIMLNQVDRAGGAGVFPETVSDLDVSYNQLEGCINGVQANCIAGTMQGVKVSNNTATNCQNGFAHTGAHTTRWVGNKARGFTYGGFVLGTVSGEASYASYDGFEFKPSSHLIPLVVVPDGVIGANFNDPGICHFIVQADTANPTPRVLWFFSTTATLFGTRKPIFGSGTEDTPNARLRNAVVDGRFEYSNPLLVFADNASAVAALGPGREYKRDPDGPKYETF